MATTIAVLREECVQLVTGTEGKRPSVSELITVPVREASMESWGEALASLRKEGKLPQRNVTLVLPWESVNTRTITAPEMKIPRLIELVQHEMQRGEDKVASDYIPFGEAEAGKVQLYCASVRLDLVHEMQQMFRSLGVQLRRITTPMEARLALPQHISEMRSKACVWLCFEGASVQSLLWENGVYRYAGRSRIFSEPGTVDFGTEVTRNVSGTLQFQSARRGEAITDVYWVGCDRDNFSVCMPGLENMGLRAAALPAPDGLRLPGGKVFSDYADGIGALMTAKQERYDLLAAARRFSQTKAEPTSHNLRYFAVPIALMAAGVLVWGSIAVSNFLLSRRVHSIESWLADPSIIEQYGEAVRKNQINDSILSDVSEADRLRESLATYPDVDTALIDKIRAAGGEKVEMVLTGWNAETGEIQFEAHSADVIDIPSYVLSLENTKLFRSVTYTGYNYTDGQYVLSLSCILEGKEAAQP